MQAGREGPGSLDLTAMKGAIAHPGIEIPRNQDPGGYVRPGIFREVGQDRQMPQIGFLANLNDLMHRAIV